MTLATLVMGQAPKHSALCVTENHARACWESWFGGAWPHKCGDGDNPATHHIMPLDIFETLMYLEP